MTRASVAEWVLSLVMPRERAAAVVGDLTEATGSAPDLWIAVLRTLLGTTFRQWTPLTMVRGVILALLFTAAARIFFMSVTMRGARYIGLGPMNQAFGPTRSLLTPIMVGWLAARLLPGRESSVWAAGLLIASTISLTSWVAPSALPTAVAPTFVLPPLAWLMLLAAAVFAHYKKWPRAAGLLPLLPVLLEFTAAWLLPQLRVFQSFVVQNVLLPHNSLTLLLVGAVLARVQAMRREGVLTCRA